MGADKPSTGWTPLREQKWSRLRSMRVPQDEKQQSFLRLALTHALASAGDAIVTVSLAGTIFFTTSLNGARPKLVLSLLLTMAPFAVVAPFLGPAIDRSRGGRRLMIIASAGGRAVVCLYMATVVRGLMLYPCALAILILSKAYSVAKSALVPATVDSPAEYVKAGGRLAIVATVSGFLAGVPAALVWKVFDASWSLRLAALVYAAGAVAAARIRPAPPAHMDPPDHVDEAARSLGVSLASTCMITLRACSGFLTFAVAFIFRRTHAPAYWYGLVGAFALAGGFVGNVIGPRLRKVIAEERIITAALTAVALTAVLVARMDDRFGLALLAFVMGLADGVGQLSFDAIVQRDGTEGLRARSFARFEASFQVAWVGSALIPVIVRVPLWVAAVTMAAATGASAITYVVGRHTAARETDGDDRQPGRAAPAAALAFEPADPRRSTPPVPGTHRAREQDVWSAVRPGPAPTVGDPTPPLGTPVVEEADSPPPLGTPVVEEADPSPLAHPRDPGPRRNPRRSGPRP